MADETEREKREKRIQESTRALEAFAASRIMNAPIAAVLPAEPGWRVVLHEPHDGDRSRLFLADIAFWAVEPALLLPRPEPKAPLTSALGLLQVLQGPGPETRRTPAFPLYPLDAERKRFDIARLVAWVGPDEPDDEAVLRRLVEHLEREAERLRKETEKMEGPR